MSSWRSVTGSLLGKALKADMILDAVHFKQGRFRDIGTPERLAQSTEFMVKA